LIAAKANVAYVAPAVTPLDDVGTIGMDLVEQVIRIYDNFGYQTQIVVAEATNPIHVLDAALMGADVAVLPGRVIEQLFRHPLTLERSGRPS
jgi:transaldolase